MLKSETYKMLAALVQKHDLASMPGRARFREAEQPPKQPKMPAVDDSLAAQILRAGEHARNGIEPAPPTDPVAAAIVRAGKLRRGEPV